MTGTHPKPADPVSIFHSCSCFETGGYGEREAWERRIVEWGDVLRRHVESLYKKESESLSFFSYLVDPASSHMLVSKIKPCMSKCKRLYTVKLRMAH